MMFQVSVEASPALKMRNDATGLTNLPEHGFQ